MQLKRYEYKADQGESIKRSWKVPVTSWLTLDEFVIDGATEPSSWKPHTGRLVIKFTLMFIIGALDIIWNVYWGINSDPFFSITPRSSKQTTLTVRNLSSELNVFEGRKEQEESSVCASVSPKSQEITAVPPTSDKEDEELQVC